MRIDSHQHFWKFDPQRYSWIGQGMEGIQQDFMPKDLEPLLQQHRMAGTVAVHAIATEEDTDFLLQLAYRHDWIKKVVGWVDLRAADLEIKLAQWQTAEKLAGFRHVGQSEPPESLYDPNLRKGIGLLQQKGYSIDLVIFPEHLKGVYDLVKDFSEQRFVLNHLAKPHIKAGAWKAWSKDFQRLGDLPNLYCKLSGMITEADWKNWRQEEIWPYLDVAFKTFGPQRLMFGSDWPVALLAGAYEEVVNLVEQYISTLSEAEQRQVMGGNACEFYKILP